MRVVIGFLLAALSGAAWAQPPALSADKFAAFSASLAAATQITLDLGERCKSALRDDLNHPVCEKFQQSFDYMGSLLKTNAQYWTDETLFDRPEMNVVTAREMREFSASMEMMSASIKAMDYVEEYRAMFK